MIKLGVVINAAACIEDRAGANRDIRLYNNLNNPVLAGQTEITKQSGVVAQAGDIQHSEAAESSQDE